MELIKFIGNLDNTCNEIKFEMSYIPRVGEVISLDNNSIEEDGDITDLGSYTDFRVVNVNYQLKHGKLTYVYFIVHPIVQTKIPFV